MYIFTLKQYTDCYLILLDQVVYVCFHDVNFNISWSCETILGIEYTWIVYEYIK